MAGKGPDSVLHAILSDTPRVHRTLCLDLPAQNLTAQELEELQVRVLAGGRA